jgi:hypothetical protein
MPEDAGLILNTGFKIVDDISVVLLGREECDDQTDYDKRFHHIS